ncbi:copper chaperone CopZ [Alkalicoccobacillus murimartini]|uniref:Copper chaperone CopZ n=1 Tax=Alkalicoccobacillus murimartini TaxID=171685 RepID=A0ABT9YH08_9BACI|nr:copper chaperone CopZ [Alkalicoccobacillus murimartini]MDQ0207125.1 copper chaperone [Alkalicoccobacillus murimartini]
MKNSTLNVTGMSCQHCVNAVESNVGKLSGVETVKVDLGQASVEIRFEESQVPLSEIIETIEDQGFDVTK